MTDLEIRANLLWKEVCTLRAGGRCEITGTLDKYAFPPHSVHHLIKRRFIRTCWMMENGIYLSAKIHALAEGTMQDKFEFGEMLKAKLPARYEWFIRHQNPPITRYADWQMAKIVEHLEREKRKYC